MVFRVGYCPGCDCQIMVQDIRGRWNSFKANRCEALLTFEDGHKMPLAMCKSCAANPNFEKIADAVTHAESTVGADDVKTTLKARGVPVSLSLRS